MAIMVLCCLLGGHFSDFQLNTNNQQLVEVAV